MGGTNLDSFNEKLNSKYNGLIFHEVVDNGDGSHSLLIGGNNKVGLDNILARVNVDCLSTLSAIDKEQALSKFKKLRTEKATIINRDSISPSYLDLLVTPGVATASPQVQYKRSVQYYRTEDVYGSSIDLLTNFASKGLKNDIDDPNIRNFYDNWVIDTGFDKIVEQIFFEYFRSGFVRTYKLVSKYIPKVNYMPPVSGQGLQKVNEDVAFVFNNDVWLKKRKEIENNIKKDVDSVEFMLMGYKERSAKKLKWSKDYMPIRYTILDPTMVEIESSSFLLDQQLVKLKSEALKDVKDLLEVKSSDLTEHQKMLLKSIPSDMKAAAQAGEALILDPYLVGAVDYRRQPYETYPYPRGARSFESMEYKKALRNADYSTLDGITNYLLVVTVGNDQYPLKSQDVLETVMDLFDTPSKSFSVGWDHTLKVSRVEPANIGDILGQDKYKQVNDDITGAFGVIRALIDGVGNPSKASADLAVKSIIEEIYTARREVRRWIYREYRDVAEAMAFERYPRVRFDNMILKDEIQMMTVIQGMIDRRIISYRLGHDMLSVDHDTVRSELEEEAPLVQSGVLGIIGSPYQQSGGGGGFVQEIQRTPKGTPSEGRPKGQPAKTPAEPDKTKVPKPEKALFDQAMKPILDDMGPDEVFILSQYIREELLKKLNRE